MLLQCVSLLLPVAATCGWYFGRKEREHFNKKKMFSLRKDYFRGLNYIIDEQPDKAVDVFVQLVEVDSETVETHLALGGLFRRRGEVDRAIRVHQNLIARPSLSKEHRLSAMLALGKDYYSAGVFDRAEKIFLKLVKYGFEERVVLHKLIRIYQQEKAWSKAIQIARKYESSTKVMMSQDISHFYCELALEMKLKTEYFEAKKYLKQAVTVDKYNPRAHIILAEVEESRGAVAQSIQHYQHALDLQPSLIPIVLPSLYAIFISNDQKNRFVEYILSDLKEKYHVARLPAGELRQFLYGVNSLNDALLMDFQTHVSLFGLEYLVASYLSKLGHTARENLLQIYQWLLLLVKQYSQYQCSQCGFDTNTLSWVCPSCHAWSTFEVRSEQGS